MFLDELRKLLVAPAAAERAVELHRATSSACRLRGWATRSPPLESSFDDHGRGVLSRVMSVATFVEVSIVLEARYGAEGLRALDRFIERAGIDFAPVDLEQARAARDAFSRFGKGRHAAALNFGDCFSYALARVLGEPLLSKGDDFSQTDIRPSPGS